MKVLNALVLLALIFLPGLNLVQAATEPAGNLDFAALDSVIEAQMAKHALPGMALAVVEDGHIAYLNGYGAAGNGQRMTAQTKMVIGSQSKSFTALAIAQLAEQGKVDLDAPVQAYIPWFRVADEAASSQITLDHLLHHTSGLSDSGFGVVLPPETTSEQAVRALVQARLTAPLGTQHQYFNLGYSVLSYIVEIVSGQRYAEYIQAHIFDPLGMTSSSAEPFPPADLAQGYTRLFGFPMPMDEAFLVYGVGDGYIVSTAEDMARYALAVMVGGAGLVSPDMMERILTPGLGFYGMGWVIVDNGQKIIHGGANQTFRTDVNIYPSRRRAFILLGNEGHQFDHFVSAGQLTAAVEAVVLGNPAVPTAQGWSVRWMGWGLGLFVLALSVLHTRNFLALRYWRERVRKFSPAKRAWDVAISFLIPTVILGVVFWQVSSFYGNRFNLWTNLAYLRLGLPDVFILMIIGTVPDYLQGVIKLFLRQGNSKEGILQNDYLG
ncbi:MAG: beta-lactamase family protein [Anaerolineaceae bacterium]|nr:beta-lactamase family protein [Anaerolineaceae bacterium]